MKKNSQAGMTIIELLIAAIMTISVVAAAFDFYVKSHKQYLSQEDISEAQENLRASVEEIGRQVRMAGFNLPDSISAIVIDSVSSGPDTLEINRDTLTIRYYVDLTDTINPTLIKEVEGRTEIYSEQIKDLQVNRVSFNAFRITLQSQGYKYDDDVRQGERVERTESKVIAIRNIN
jgi:type II secretory pathway pseudopilin PulG